MVTTKRRLLVTLSPDDERLIEALREKLGYRHQSQVMRKALRDLAKEKLK